MREKIFYMEVKKDLTQKYGVLKTHQNLILLIIIYHRIKRRAFQENFAPHADTQSKTLFLVLI